ncbi:hypothetical protein K438DRAFT_1773968 [Mycena galopus ATCC 62051]|nr:hypothetical protein K438DRAFT_1773968 [Mycena galopus ATCC 62051]
MEDSDLSPNPEETNEDRRCRLQREAQRKRCTPEDEEDREARCNQNTMARRTARSPLPDDRVVQICRDNRASRTQHGALLDLNRRYNIQQHNRTAHLAQYHTSHLPSGNTQWWDRIGALNTSEIAKPLGLRWNRNCKVSRPKTPVFRRY